VRISHGLSGVPFCIAIWKHGACGSATLARGLLPGLGAGHPHEAKGDADHSGNRKHQHFLLVLDGRNIEAVKGAVGDEGADEEGREVQREGQVAKPFRKPSEDDGANGTENDACDDDLRRYPHVYDVADKVCDIHVVD
jgi:hypothetical protein